MLFQYIDLFTPAEILQFVRHASLPPVQITPETIAAALTNPELLNSPYFLSALTARSDAIAWRTTGGFSATLNKKIMFCLWWMIELTPSM